MAWGRGKIDRADKYFSLWVRHRAGWNCERCGKHYEPPTNLLHCSHFVGRGKESTRFDPDNANALCFHDHQFFTSHPQEHYQWQIEKKGEKLVKEVILRSNMRCKKDRKMQALAWKQALKTDFNVTA